MESQLESAVHLWDLFINRLQPAFYLYQISVPKCRRALAHFNVFPTAVLEGKYKKKIAAHLFCPSLRGAIETKADHLFYSPCYCPPSDEQMSKFLGHPDILYLYYLLDGYLTSLNVAKFCYFMNKFGPQMGGNSQWWSLGAYFVMSQTWPC